MLCIYNKEGYPNDTIYIVRGKTINLGIISFLFLTPFSAVGALAQAVGVGEGDGAVFFKHLGTIEVTHTVRITAVWPRAGFECGSRSGSRMLGSREVCPESTKTFDCFRDSARRTCLRPGARIVVYPDVKADVEDGGDGHQGHFPWMGSENLTQ